MNEAQSRMTVALDDPKLERLANLLGEFLAKAWLKRNAEKDNLTVVLNKMHQVKARMANGTHES